MFERKHLHCIFLWVRSSVNVLQHVFNSGRRYLLRTNLHGHGACILCELIKHGLHWRSHGSTGRDIWNKICHMYVAQRMLASTTSTLVIVSGAVSSSRVRKVQCCYCCYVIGHVSVIFQLCIGHIPAVYQSCSSRGNSVFYIVLSMNDFRHTSWCIHTWHAMHDKSWHENVWHAKMFRNIKISSDEFHRFLPGGMYKAKSVAACRLPPLMPMMLISCCCVLFP